MYAILIYHAFNFEFEGEGYDVGGTPLLFCHLKTLRLPKTPTKYETDAEPRVEFSKTVGWGSIYIYPSPCMHIYGRCSV